MGSIKENNISSAIIKIFDNSNDQLEDIFKFEKEDENILTDRLEGKEKETAENNALRFKNLIGEGESSVLGHVRKIADDVKKKLEDFKDFSLEKLLELKNSTILTDSNPAESVMKFFS